MTHDRTIPITKLFLHPDNPREELADAELLSSIQANGLLCPILVRPFDDGYQVLDGHRRLHSLKAAGALHVDCIVRKVDDHRASFLVLETNLNQKTLTPVEEARALARRMTQFGLTQTQIAEEYNRSQTWVSQRLALLPSEEKPVRVPEKGGRPTSTEVIGRPITSPELASKVRSAPAETQAAVAKAVEDHNLSTRKTKALADALKKVEPAKRQEVAEIAAASPDPIAVAEPAVPLSFTRSVHGESAVEAAQQTASHLQEEAAATAEMESQRHPWFDAHGRWIKDAVFKHIGPFAKAALVYEVRIQEGGHPNWEACPTEGELRRFAEFLTLHNEFVTGIIAEVNAELERRSAPGEKVVRLQAVQA